MVRKISYLLNAVLVLLLAAFLLAVEGHLDGYKIQILNLIAVNIILALSLNLIYGFTGLFSLGHAGFMAIGAYVCAMLVLSPEHKQMLFILEPPAWPFSVMQTSFFTAVLAGGLAAALFGFLMGFPVLRLGGDYLGIATLGFAEIIRVLATNLPRVTNGALGLKGIPLYANLWWNYAWCLITLYCIVRLVRSNFGNALMAIRDDEKAAQSMGIDVFKYKLISFTIGAFFAGIGGALLGNLLTTIDPKMFLFVLTFNVLMIVVTGGLGSITGTVLAGIAITVLLEWLRFVENPVNLWGFEIPGVPGMRMVVFSLVLIFIILFRREGIMGMREFSWQACGRWVEGIKQRRRNARLAPTNPKGAAR
jgi:branched-chain amino acid transport system permease protein